MQLKTRNTGSVDTLKQLRVFLSVADAGGISQAAARIFKAPSAITRTISELELGLGMNLFDRKPRGMWLNAHGHVVLLRAKRIEQEVQGAADEFYKGRSKATSLANLMYSEHKLNLFIAIAQSRNLSKVASVMGMSQAGISMALSRMESELGQALFHRMLQGMVPSDAAARLLGRAKRILAELRHLRSDLSALDGPLKGDVVIGALPLGRTLIVPLSISNALRKHPHLRITTLESPYESLLLGLKSGEVDFIFGALRSHEFTQGLLAEPLVTDQLSIITRAGHPLTSSPKLRLNDLLSHLWILPRQDAPARHLVNALFDSKGLPPPQPSVETGDLAIVRSLLACSDMITAISPQQLRFELESAQLAELPLILEQTQREIGLTTRDGSQLSPAAKAVMDEIRIQAQISFLPEALLMPESHQSQGWATNKCTGQNQSAG